MSNNFAECTSTIYSGLSWRKGGHQSFAFQFGGAIKLVAAYEGGHAEIERSTV